MESLSEVVRRMAVSSEAEGGQGGSEALDAGLPGDPDCPICEGKGFLHRDLPVSDPQFGKLVPCECVRRKEQAALERHLRGLGVLGSYEAMTFESFRPQGRGNLRREERESLAAALDAARRFAGSPEGWLVLLGECGVGKTHLAASIAHAALGNGTAAVFETVPGLLDWLRKGFEADDYAFEERFAEIRDVELLVLDDLGSHNATPWAEEKLFELLDYRYVRRLATVVTSNLSAEEMSARLRSRLLDRDLSRVVELRAPDYRAPQGASPRGLTEMLDALRGCTLGSFGLRKAEGLKAEARDQLALALRGARAYAEKPEGWIVFSGPSASGKSHLAAAIANRRREEGERVGWLFVPELVAELGRRGGNEVVEAARGLDLLVLDDWGDRVALPSAQAEFLSLVNYRYARRLPTVFTTLLAVHEMIDGDDRVGNRLLDGRLCAIYSLGTVPAFRPVAKGRRP